jgi:CRISPR-associated protein Csy1
MDTQKIINQALNLLKENAINNSPDIKKFNNKIKELELAIKNLKIDLGEKNIKKIEENLKKIAEQNSKKIKKIEELEIEFKEEYLFENFFKNFFYAKNGKTESFKIENLKSNITSHPYKFTNPQIESDLLNLFYKKNNKINDGFIYSDNVKKSINFDCSGNASTTTKYVEIYEFLDSKYDNSSKIIDLFNQDEEFIVNQSKEAIELIKQEISKQKNKKNSKRKNKNNSLKPLDEEINYQTIKEKINDFYHSNSNLRSTNTLIKQVYFPVSSQKNSQDYHLLSILPPSILMNELNSRIKSTNNESYELKENQKDYTKFLNLIILGYSEGSFQKMLNVSNINKNNAGKFYLLPSLPPQIEKREIRLPKKNFFYESLNFYQFKQYFEQLDKLFKDRDNKIIRDSITDIVGEIASKVIEIIYKIRDLDSGWSEQENYKNLAKNQKILLDNYHQESREGNKELIDDFVEDLARFIMAGYDKYHPDFAKDFGDDEYQGFKRRVRKSLNQIKGVLS